MSDPIKTHSIDQAKFYPLLDEGDECQGGVNPPSYDDGMEIPCVKTVTWEDQITEATDRGGNRVCTRVSRLDEVLVTITHAGTSFELSEAMRNHVLSSFTSGGVTGRRLKRQFTQQLLRGAIMARAPKPDGSGCLTFLAYNCEVTLGPGGSFEDDAFLGSSFTARADPSLFAPCEDAYDLVEHDELVDLPTTFPGTGDWP